MVDIKTVVRNMNMKALGGAKIPHAVSNPVLRMEDGKLCIASFIYVFGRQNLQTNQMPRPIHWILADAASGEVLREYNCREKDFSDAGFDQLYDLNDPNVIRPGREDFAEIYRLFDTVRDKYLADGSWDGETYRQYLDRILEITPNSYRQFYLSLSNL